MDIRISKKSEVPLRQPLAEQIVLLIATEKLKPAEALPSVRELARRLASAVGRRHTLVECLLPLENLEAFGAADLVLCDSLARRSVRARNCVQYRLVAPASLEYLASAIKRPRQGERSHGNPG